MRRKVRNTKRGKREGRQRRVQRMLLTSDRTRLTIFRSARHIYAQLVDPTTGRTLVTVSSRSPAVIDKGEAPGKLEVAKKVGTAIAVAARERQIEQVVFHRNGFLFHGRVKALAEAAREAGLQF